MRLHLNYTLCKEDIVDFNLFIFWSDPLKKDLRTKYYFTTWVYFSLSFLVVTALLGSMKNNIDSFRMLSITLLAALVLVLSFGGYLAKSNLKKQVEKLLLSPQNEKVLIPTEITITDNGLESRDQFAHSVYSWDAFVRRVETPKANYLFLNTSHGLVIPNWAMTSQEKEILDSLLNQNVTFRADLQTLIKEA